ncbi:hypothetical protein ACQPZX_41560 [Actinoplanes sp. CA-142083]|uniref:hypothetical protein n=1 Tax=Actinoplanes sp. CA-142083 TaxID=3239903 RepID=UPI003D8B9ABA
MAEPRFQIRPLGLWDRPVTDPRASSARFRAPWSETIKLLLGEVELLDGGLVVIQVDADPGDIRQDGMLRARAQVGFPGVKISFESKHGPLTYATDAYEQQWQGSLPSWQANVRAIALGLGALRAVDRYGITRTGEQYRGWSALTAAPAEKTLSVEEAKRVLRDAGRVPDDMPLRTVIAVTAAFRRAARTAHPDAGGNPDAFRLITAARDVLLREFGGAR